MSEPKVKEPRKKSSSGSAQNSSEMNRSQALAVSWTGLEALAKSGQLVICNDKTTGYVWFGIANAEVVSVGKDKAGKDLYDLVDTQVPPTPKRAIANASVLAILPGE